MDGESVIEPHLFVISILGFAILFMGGYYLWKAHKLEGEPVFATDFRMRYHFWREKMKKVLNE